ncbi:MAG: DUF998 domain-containing protein [Candidatus Freyarchaeum deiterrae]
MTAKKIVMELNPRVTLLGGVLAIVAMTFTVIFISTAVLFNATSPLRPWFFSIFVFPSPNFGFSILDRYLSELGAGPTSGPIYNYGLMITGILSIPVFPILRRLLERKRVAIGATVVGVAGSIALIGVGIFPMYVGVFPALEPEHGLFSFAFFALIGLAIILASYAMYSSEIFPKAISWFGVIVIVVDIILAILGIPAAEWSTTTLFVIWVYVVGIQMLRERNVTKIRKT